MENLLKSHLALDFIAKWDVAVNSEDKANKLLGELLIAKDLITSADLKQALEQQGESGGLIGAILVSEGYLSNLELARAIAEKEDLDFVDTLITPPDLKLLEESEKSQYLRLESIPWRRENGVVVIATAAITEQLKSWASLKYGRYNFAITSRFDILWSVANAFAESDDNDSRLKLWRANPESSARSLLLLKNKEAYLALSVVFLMICYMYSNAVIIGMLAALNVFFLAAIIFKSTLFVVGMFQPQPDFKELTRTFKGTISDRDLPMYTVLVPLHNESEIVPDLLRRLNALDYPKTKIDIKLIVEEFDKTTIAAIKREKPGGMFEIITVPYSLPTTKPKACNYALRFARGKLVTIFDAEDMPHPKQLKAAAEHFIRSQKNAKPNSQTGCLQARLNYYNANRNWLTRMFSMEYAVWFDYMLPALQKLRLPIPLGGTSNHLRLETLHQVDGWDPYNVTEDADLGMRLAIDGHKTAMLNSITMEEAPAHFSEWYGQRSRWIKGYMQTYLVHMRKPLRLIRKLNPWRFLGFQLFIGGPTVIFLTTPIMLVISVLWYAGALSVESFPAWLAGLATFNIVYGLFLHFLIAVAVTTEDLYKANKTPLQGLVSILTFPFYWWLHSLASFRALWELFLCPFYWHKTKHAIQ
jgi:cellulose synthase/poly-beta-1,6-N-acetylglucosamine synthase-like glycosyltransferase